MMENARKALTAAAQHTFHAIRDWIRQVSARLHQCVSALVSFVKEYERCRCDCTNVYPRSCAALWMQSGAGASAPPCIRHRHGRHGHSQEQVRLRRRYTVRHLSMILAAVCVGAFGCAGPQECRTTSTPTRPFASLSVAQRGSSVMVHLFSLPTPGVLRSKRCNDARLSNVSMMLRIRRGQTGAREETVVQMEVLDVQLQNTHDTHDAEAREGN